MSSRFRMAVAALLSSSVFCTASAQTNCALTPYGRNCGPKLSGEVTARNLLPHVVLDLEGAGANAWGLTMIGFTSIDVPIPGTTCSLATIPSVSVVFRADGGGRAQHAFPVPQNVLLALSFQDLTFDIVANQVRNVRTTNGLALTPCVLTSVDEDFAKTTQRDELRNGANWAAAKATPARLGGSGELGDFDITNGKDTGKKDSAGRQIYEWDTGLMTIPGKQTLSGKSVTVTNGVFEFLSFVVPSGAHLRFVGSRPAVVRATGTIRIDGAVTAEGVDGTAPPRTNERTPRVGQSGMAGGPGGGSGGKGGDWHTQSANIDGTNGQAVQLPQGHPLAAAAAATAGQGSQSNPPVRNQRVQGFLQISPGFFMVQHVPSGGGGGGFVTAGGAGSFKINSSVYVKPPVKPQEMGKIAQGGTALTGFAGLLTRPEASAFLFGIGGAGGGGAGSNMAGTFQNSFIVWSSGAGGAGGGGVLQLSAGWRVSTSGQSLISAQGGDGPNTVGNVSGYYPAPGGAGSGGSVLIQSGNLYSIAGAVDARGGVKGRLDANGGQGANGLGFCGIDPYSGDGGDGFLRLEAPTRPDYKKLTTFQPAATAANTGQLRAVDDDTMSALATLWQPTGGIKAPTYLYYVIDANVDGRAVSYSDAAGQRRAGPGQAVQLHAQTAKLDPNTGQPIPDSLSPWASATLTPLNSKPGDAIRYVLHFDLSQTTTNKIEVRRVRLFFAR